MTKGKDKEIDKKTLIGSFIYLLRLRTRKRTANKNEGRRLKTERGKSK